MPYDIHIAENKGAASRQSPKRSLSDQEHDEIFVKNINIKVRYPMIFSMSDYYRDCIYSYASLDNLKSEIERIKIEMKESQQLTKFIDEFEKIVDEAKSKNQSIYCFCD